MFTEPGQSDTTGPLLLVTWIPSSALPSAAWTLLTPPPSLHPVPSSTGPACPSPASPLSLRLRKDSLRLRCRLKPPSSSALPGEPGIMLVWNQGRCQGPSTPPTLPGIRLKPLIDGVGGTATTSASGQGRSLGFHILVRLDTI